MRCTGFFQCTDMIISGVQLASAPILEYMESNIIMLKWMVAEGYGDARTMMRRAGAFITRASRAPGLYVVQTGFPRAHGAPHASDCLARLTFDRRRHARVDRHREHPQRHGRDAGAPAASTHADNTHAVSTHAVSSACGYPVPCVGGTSTVLSVGTEQRCACSCSIVMRRPSTTRSSLCPSRR